MIGTSIDGASLLEASVADVHALYERRALRPSDLVDFHLRRVAQLDLDTDRGAPFNAVLSIDPRVRERALVSDRELAGGGATGPLHGIPVWVKDSVDVQGLPTMCGCLALEQNVPARDAELVADLRRAGAIIMGKVGMTELALGISPHSTASVRIGNAFDPRNPPGGSSNGSAVAVSLGFGTLAVGVDDCTSIVTPAAFNGCVGLRPTVGVVPRGGLWSYSESDTSPGPMGRTVRDVAAMLGVLARESAPPGGPDAGRGLHPDALRGRRIGVLEEMNSDGLPAGASDVLVGALAKLREAGADVVEGVRIEGLSGARLSILEYYNSILHALRRSTGAPRTFRALLRSPKIAPHTRKSFENAWTKHGPSITLPNFFAGRYRATLRHNQALLGAFLAKERLDCLVTITSPTVSLLSTVTQAPHLTVPAGFCRTTAEDVTLAPGSLAPVGLSFMASPGADRTLLELGFAFEQATSWRTQPRPDVPASAVASADLDIERFNALKRHIGHGAHHLLKLGAGIEYMEPSPEAFRAEIVRLKAEFGSVRGMGEADSGTKRVLEPKHNRLAAEE